MTAGPTHVLVHGSPGGPGVWRAVQDALGPDVACLTPSLRGHEDAGDRPPAGLTVEDRAADVLAACERAGEPVVLVGHSFGGVVALAAALARPELVARLVLVEPVLVAPESDFARTRDEMNLVVVDSRWNGRIALGGPGAGGGPTATGTGNPTIRAPNYK